MLLFSYLGKDHNGKKRVNHKCLQITKESKSRAQYTCKIRDDLKCSVFQNVVQFTAPSNIQSHYMTYISCYMPNSSLILEVKVFELLIEAQ